MLRRPSMVPLWASLALQSVYLVLVAVLTAHVENSYNDAADELVRLQHREARQDYFAVAAGVHGILTLLLVVLLYVQMLRYVPSRVQGYAHFNARLGEWSMYLQYVYTAFSAVVMLLLIVSSQMGADGGRQRALDRFIFDNFFYLLGVAAAEYAVVAALAGHTLRFVRRYAARGPAPDSLSYAQVLGLGEERAAADAQVLRGQQDAIQKMAGHLEQLGLQHAQLRDQLASCRTKQTSPEFERIRLELQAARQTSGDTRLRIRQMERELRVVSGENEYLQGQIEGFRRSARQGMQGV